MDVFNPESMMVNSAAWVTGAIVGVFVGWFAHKVFHDCGKK